MTLGLAACGGAYYLRRGRSVVRAVPVAPAPPNDPVRCPTVRVVARHDGVEEVLCGPVRESLPPVGEPTVGVEQFDAPIFSATPVPSGWVFVTASGLVARSDTFTGRLRRLGDIQCGIGESPPSRGRVAVVDYTGTLWTTDGSRPIAASPFSDRVHSAAFIDPTHGAAALFHGALMVTSDGGATWTHADLGGDLATGVLLVGDELIANTTAGAKRVTPDGLRPYRVAAVTSQSIEYEGSTPRIESAAQRATESVLPSGHEARCSPSRPPAPYDPPGAEYPPDLQYVCHIAGTTGEAPTRLRGVPADARLHHTTYAATSGFAEFAGWRTTDRELRIAAYWTGVDAAGRFAGTAGPLVTGPDLTPGLHDVEWQMYDDVMVEGISRAGMVFSGTHLGDVLWWAAPGGPVVALGRPSAEGLGLGESTGSLAAPLPDGGMALLSWAFKTPRTVGVALEISAAGAVVHARAFIADTDGSHRLYISLARRNGALGIVRRGDGGEQERLFFPLDGSPAEAFPQAIGEVNSCTGPAAPGSTTLWSDGAPWIFEPATDDDARRGGGTFGSVQLTEYELAGGSECLRSLVLSWGAINPPRGIEGTPASMRPRPGRRFEGTLNDLGQRRVTCRPGEPRRRRPVDPRTREGDIVEFADPDELE